MITILLANYTIFCVKISNDKHLLACIDAFKIIFQRVLMASSKHLTKFGSKHI